MLACSRLVNHEQCARRRFLAQRGLRKPGCPHPATWVDRKLADTKGRLCSDHFRAWERLKPLEPRNTLVARVLNDRGMATLLFDLLTTAEELDRVNAFNIPLLAGRLVEAIRWINDQPSVAELPLGLFGASTGAAAALVAAARLPRRVEAIVSRGGRPDLARDALDQVHAPTLFIVGGNDVGVIDLNEHAMARLRGPKSLQIIAHASHLFPEPGALEAVIEHAARWFQQYLSPTHSASASRRTEVA